MDIAKIKKLVGDAHLDNALNLLSESNDERISREVILLKSRLNQASSDRRYGVCDFREFAQVCSQITQGILYLIKQIDPTTISNNSQEKEETMNNATETKLQAAIAENRRRRPDVANQASELLKRYQDYNTQVKTGELKDPTGRRERALNESITKFFTELQEIKEDSLEAIVARITELLGENVPNYQNLKEAYNLCVGRGLTDVSVEKALTTEADDDDIKITIAERIESLVDQIKVK